MYRGFWWYGRVFRWVTPAVDVGADDRKHGGCNVARANQRAGPMAPIRDARDWRDVGVWGDC